MDRVNYFLRAYVLDRIVIKMTLCKGVERSNEMSVRYLRYEEVVIMKEDIFCSFSTMKLFILYLE